MRELVCIYLKHYWLSTLFLLMWMLLTFGAIHTNMRQSKLIANLKAVNTQLSSSYSGCHELLLHEIDIMDNMKAGDVQ